MSTMDIWADKNTFAASAAADVTSFEYALTRTQGFLKAEKDRLQLLLDLTSQIASNLELGHLLHAASAIIRRIVQCDAVAVHLPDKESSALRLFAFDSHGRTSMDEGDDDGHQKDGGEEIYEVFRSRKPIFSRNSTGCVLPLVSRDRVWGVLVLDGAKEQVFLQQEIDLVKQIANQVAIAIENALAYAEIKDL